MDTTSIIADLEEQRDRLTQAIDALRGGGRNPDRRFGRGKRHLSAASRKLISEKMKKKWAERKRLAKKEPQRTAA